MIPGHAILITPDLRMEVIVGDQIQNDNGSVFEVIRSDGITFDVAMTGQVWRNDTLETYYHSGAPWYLIHSIPRAMHYPQGI